MKNDRFCYGFYIKALHINLSSCRTSEHVSLSLQRLSWDSLGAKNGSFTRARNFWKVSKSWRQKRCRNRVYPPELMQTSLLGRLLKKSLERNDCRPQRQRRVRKHPMDNIPSPQNYFRKNCRSVIPVLLKSIGTTPGQFA